MMGMEIVPFSPLRDHAPPHAGALYIGGGFPEVFAQELENNALFRAALRENLEAGTPCYAECGGLMYLCGNMEDDKGGMHQMTGFFPAAVRMTKALQRFGYATVTTRAGREIHAHEFHYSVLETDSPAAYSFRVRKPDGSQSWKCGLARQNTVAGYPHLHFWGNPEVIPELFFGKGIPV
jgi:cobyrinic acid a,c-diamide synthase